MKPILLLLFIGLTLASCNRDGDKTPLEQLPPATTSGKNTAGCLVNGEVFLPGKQQLHQGPVLQSFYQYINGKYVFGVNFSNDTKYSELGLRTVSIASQNFNLEEGKTYILGLNVDNKLYGKYFLIKNGDINTYVTNETSHGELKITKLDKTNSIISGTFWYDAVNDKGEKVQIREGRFDLLFSQ